MERHKTIVFDFGNVLINLNFEASFNRFGSLLKVDWSGNNLPKEVQASIIEYDKGFISDEDFLASFHRFKPDIDPEELATAWNLILEDFPRTRLDFLEQTRENYRIALLSNTNNIHIGKVRQMLKDQYGIDDFEERFFDHVFYSHEIGLRKPELPIFKYVEDRMDTIPEDILFIDDMRINVIAAKSQDWNAVVHDPSKEISEEFPRYVKFFGFENG